MLQLCESMYIYTCMFVGDLFTSILALVGNTSIQVTNGAEGRRRHATYSRCFTPSAVRRFYDVYNQVTVSFVLFLGLPLSLFCCWVFVHFCVFMCSTMLAYFLGTAFNHMSHSLKGPFTLAQSCVPFISCNAHFVRYYL